MLKIPFLACMLALAAFAQPAAPNASMVRFDVNAIDKSADPCVDFYQYACGTWLKNNPIPADQSRWGRFNELDERNREILREILEEAAKPTPDRDADTQKIGDYYAACMDEKAIDAKGLAPLAAGAGPHSRAEGQVATCRPKSRTCTASAYRCPVRFRLRAGLQGFQRGDRRRPTRAVSGCRTAITTSRTDAKAVELRKKYVAHVQRMFELAGETPDSCQGERRHRDAHRNRTGQRSLDRVSRRDPEKVYHKMKQARIGGAGPILPAGASTSPTAVRRDSRAECRVAGFLQGDQRRRSENAAAGRLESLSRPGTCCTPKRRCCRRRSSRRTSISTARR